MQRTQDHEEGIGLRIRKAFVMKVHPEHLEEYRRRHQPIWPELEALLRAHGVHRYSIFHHPQTHQLFAYAEIESESRWQAIADTAVCRRWWESMQSLMETEPAHRPAAVPLTEMFHLAPHP